MRLTEGYAARTVRFLELWESSGWTLKVYGLAYRGDQPGNALIDAARAAARNCLPQPPETPDRYGVGFMGIHEGRGANLVFVDWWSHENELRHRAFLATASAPLDLTDVTADGLAGCVWDLAVIGFERQAWISSVLLNAEAPDIARYLNSHFEGAI